MVTEPAPLNNPKREGERPREPQDSTVTFPDTTAILLAGGKSTRMGQDKALLEIDGAPLIARLINLLAPHFEHLCISAQQESDYATFGIPIIPDTQPDQGPLQGVISALHACSTSYAFIIACDMPIVNISLIQRLLDQLTNAPIVAPIDAEGRLQPLYAAYRRDVAPQLQAQFDEGVRSLSKALGNIGAVEVAVENEMLTNLNTPADFTRFLSQRMDDDRPR